MYAIDYRENDVTALDTQTALTEQGADSPGAFVVPMNASAITEIILAASPDFTADAAHACTTAVRLTGPGLAAPESWIAGQSTLTFGAAATSAGQGNEPPMRVLCNIPVNPGQRINAYGFMHGSADMGSVRVNVSLVYDGPVRGNAKYFDYREGDTAAANTLVTLANRGGVAEGDFDVGAGVITDVIINVTNVGVAGPLGATTAHHFSGSGLATANPLKFLGNSLYTQDDSAISGKGAVTNAMQYKTDIPTQSGLIRVQAQEIEDDVGTPSHIVCLGFQ